MWCAFSKCTYKASIANGRVKILKPTVLIRAFRFSLVFQVCVCSTLTLKVQLQHVHCVHVERKTKSCCACRSLKKHQYMLHEKANDHSKLTRSMNLVSAFTALVSSRILKRKLLMAINTKSPKRKQWPTLTNRITTNS